MVNKKKYERGEIFELIFLIVYIILIIGIMSLTFGLGLGGFEREAVLEKNNFYIPYGVAFLIGVVAIKVAGLYLFKAKEANVEGALVHDPEQAPLGAFKLIQNPFLLAFFSIILFSLLGWVFTSQQTFFNQVPQYEQQFTTGADIFFSVFPASPTETLGAIFLISLLGLILGLLVKYGKVKPYWFWIFFIPGSIIVSMLYGIVNHLARYGFNEVAMQNVAIFWGFGGLITSLTGSLIPFLFMHDINNFFVSLSRLFSSDIITFITFTIIGILGLTFLLVYLRVRKKKRDQVTFVEN